MAQTNVQAFSGDVEISSNLAVNTDDLFVDTESGRVGIGTTNPGLPLEVLTGNGANYGLRLRRGSGAAFTDLGHLSTPGTEGLAFNVSDGITTTQEVMRITGTGNVGIGTVSPGAKMDIYTGSTSTVGLSFDRFASGNYRTDIYQNTYGLDFRLGYAANTPESVLYLKRFNDGSKEVEINGNVGIGTNNPATALQISRNFTATGDTSAMISFENTASLYNEWQIGPTIFNGNAGFAIKGGGDGFGNLSEIIAIKNTYVGIGTASPVAPLDIKAKKGILTATSLQNLYSNASVMITGAAENVDALCIGMLGTDYGADSGNNPYAYIQNMWDQSPNILAQPLLLNPSGGNVAINTTDPSGHTLNVNGRAFANHLQAPNYFYVYANIGADGNWRTAFNIGSTAIGFFTVLSNNAGYGQPSAIWWYQYKAGGTSGGVGRIAGSSTPTFRLSGQAVQSQGSGQQFVQVRTLPVSN